MIEVRPLESRTVSNTIEFEDGASRIDSLRKAIESSIPGELMSWTDRDLVVLDVDYHDGVEPEVSGDSLARLSTADGWAPSRSGRGLHLYYESMDGITAEERLAADAVQIALRDSSISGLDVIRSVLVPSVPVVWNENPDPRLQVARLLDSDGCSEDEIEEWLATQGMAPGKSYPHDKCPIDPDHDSHGRPVWVGDVGLVCQSCKAYGKTVPGSTEAGVVYWRQLIANAGKMHPVVFAAQALVHWAHARYTVDQTLGRVLRLPPLTTDVEPGEEPGAWRIARLLYGLLCREASIHDKDPRPAKVFTSGRWFVRGPDAVWLDSRTLEPIRQGLKEQALQGLPAVQWLEVSDDPEVEPVARVSSDSRARLASSAVFPGYDAVSVVRGTRIWGHWLDYAPGVVRGRLVDPSRMPRYLRKSHRWTESEYTDAIKRRFPGIDIKYLELLLASRGIAESGVGPVPLVAAIGPSETGKSTTVQVAALIAGDTSYVTQPGLPPDEIARAIGEHGTSRGFLVIDEIGKAGRERRGMTPDACWQPLLGLKRKFGYRRLYAGHVETEITSAVVLTDVAVPSGIRSDVQFGRRVIMVPLSQRVPQNWYAQGDLADWRQDRDAAKASDSFLSDVIDRWFGPGSERIQLTDIAHALGFDTMENWADDAGLSDIPLRVSRLYDAICHPENSGRRTTVRRSDEWRVAEYDGIDSLSTAWRDLADGLGRDTFAVSEALSAYDPSRLFSGHPVGIDVAAESHRRVRIRFRSGNGKLSNEAIAEWFCPPEDYVPLTKGLFDESSTGGNTATTGADVPPFAGLG